MPRPKGSPNKSKQSPNKPSNTLSALIDCVLQLSENFKELSAKIDRMTEQPVKEEVKPIIAETKAVEHKFPVPMEYREIVNTSLNGNFILNIEPVSDRPAFILNIFVPDKYSNITEEQKKILGGDLRTKVIDYTDGIVGVRSYVELVYRSFSPGVQAQIVMDRANLE